MKKYFYDRVGGNLIVVNTDGSQVSVIEQMKNVRVFVSGEEAYMTAGHEDNDMQSAVKPRREKHEGGVRTCGNCGETGHNARGCPNK